MANFLGTLRRRPKWLLAVAAALLVGLMLLAFSRSDDKAAVDGPMATYRVVEEPFVIQQSFSGRIAPGEQVEVLSPTDATVLEIGFNFGDRVEAGQVLFRLNPTDVWRKGAEAQIAYLQAQDTAQKMASWSSGPEVRRAERGVEAARQLLEDANSRRDEGARLFARGLIARTEMESLESALRQAMQGVTVAEEELDATRARGVGVERRVTQIQSGLAATRLQEATAGAGAIITAPRSGVMVRVQSGGMGQANGPKVGGKLNTGQSLGVIAALDGLDVLFKIDEADLALLEIGTPATVTGPGFAGRTLPGRLIGVAGEADSASSDKTQFAARVRLESLSPEDAALVRIGMTASVSLKLYEKPKAISVPVAALVNGGPQVQLRKGDGKVETRQITLGRVGPDRAEVLSGLQVGDTVIWPLGVPSAR